MKRMKPIIAIITLIPVIIAGWTYVSEFIAVDKCLDQGGSYDYREMKCDFEKSHSFIFFNHRHPKIYSGALVGIGAFVVVMIMPTKKKNRQNHQPLSPFE